MLVGMAGQIVILNGVPRSGKTSIATAMQERLPGTWIALGVDLHRAAYPPECQPGIGLRPGGERPDLEALLPELSAALYDSVAAHCRHGLDVVVDVGHHDAYSKPLGLLADAARRLEGLRTLLVGVRCPTEVVAERRRVTGMGPPSGEDDSGEGRLRAWEDEVHRLGIYDLEVDTSVLSPVECVDEIGRRLTEGPAPTALERIELLAGAVLRGNGLKLRPVGLGDVEEWLAGEDEEQRRWFEFPDKATRTDVVRAVDAWSKSWRDGGPVRHWAVCEGSGRIAGGVEVRDLGDGSVNLSYVIFPAFRRRGYATVASQLALAYAGSEFGTRRFVVKILEGNLASLAVARRLGAVEVRTEESPGGQTFAVCEGKIAPPQREARA